MSLPKPAQGSAELVRPRSLSDQVAEILVERIRSGLYPVKSQIPPEHQLAEEFAVSRATIRSAIRALSERGLVVRRNGVGTFVSQLSTIRNPLNEADDFSHMIASNGADPAVDFLGVEIVSPEERVADALDLQPDQQVLQSLKIFTADGEPVIYCINSVPLKLLGEELAREMVAAPQIIEPLFDFLEQRLNLRTDYHVARLRAEIAEQSRFPDLPLSPVSPLLFVEEVGYTTDDLPLWHSFEYFPTDRMSFELVRYRVRK